MKIGVKRFTYAVYSSGGNGAAVVYSSGEMTNDKTVHVEYSVERDDGSFYADDHRIEHENGITGVTATVELATLTKAMAQKILGWEQVSTSNEYNETGNPSPYVGIGWAIPVREGGQSLYRGVWIYKIQMGMDSDAANTKGQNVEYQTETISGAGMAVQLTSGGSDVFRSVMFESASLTACETWLKSKAGIT